MEKKKMIAGSSMSEELAVSRLMVTKYLRRIRTRTIHDDSGAEELKVRWRVISWMRGE